MNHFLFFLATNSRSAKITKLGFFGLNMHWAWYEFSKLKNFNNNFTTGVYKTTDHSWSSRLPCPPINVNQLLRKNQGNLISICGFNFLSPVWFVLTPDLTWYDNKSFFIKKKMKSRMWILRRKTDVYRKCIKILIKLL